MCRQAGRPSASRMVRQAGCPQRHLLEKVQSPLKVSAAYGRSRFCSPLVPQTKDSRSTTAKVSPDKRSVIFRKLQDNVLSCDICRRAETLLNKILVCSSCKVAVHLDCYCKIKNPIISWKCELCVEISSLSRSPINEVVDGRGRQNVHCCLCGASGGAFRKSTDGQWVHAFFAEDTVLNEKDVQSCCICHRNVGVCLKCSYGPCQITFHPSCARGAGFYLNLKSIGGRLQHVPFCEKHCLEQREVDNQHGPEELKTVKRLRVDMVIIPATIWHTGVLPRHVATIAKLKPGVLSVHEGNDVAKYFINSGFVFIHANSFADIVDVEAVPLDHIDPSLVQKRLADFTQKLNSISTDLEKAEAQIRVDVHSALNTALTG